jgi:PAS domain S-box-containing protein
MFESNSGKDKEKHLNHRLRVKILTVMLSIAILVFVASLLLNYAYSNKYYFAYNSLASIWILFIIIFLYFNYIEASEKIQEKEKKYEILFNNIDDMMILRYIDVDGKAGRVFEANDATVKFFGYSIEEMRDMPPNVFVLPTARDNIDMIFKNIVDNGSIIFETTFLSKDGRVAPVEVNSHVFMIDGQRVLMSWARDLTERVEARNTMREAEKSHKNLIEGMPDGVIIQHFPEKKSIIEFANKSAASILGFRLPEELKGKDFLEFLKPDAVIDATTRRERLLSGEKIALVERVIQTGKGIERTVEISTIPYEMGGEGRYISIIRDVTEKKANEKRIMENDHQLRRLLETMPDAVFVYDFEKYLYSNDAAAKLLGEESTADVIDKSIYTYVEPAHFENMETRLHELEKPLVDVPMIEQRLLRSDKSEVFVETKTIKFPFMGKNSFVSISRDITERLLLQEEKKKSEERYRHLIENFPDAVFVYNNESYFLANFSAAKLLGLDDPSLIVGRPLMYFFKEESKMSLRKRLSKLVENGEEPPLLEDEIVNEEGEKIPVEIKTIKFPYYDGLAFLSVVRDVSERKRNEDLRKRVKSQTEYERMRTEYFANISHDFRTPLHAISGTIQLMEMKNAEILKELPLFSVKNKRHLEIMKQNNNRLIKLVNNLIDINKIEAGVYHIVKKNRNVTEIIRNVVLSVTELARFENIKTSCQIDSGPVVLACDFDKIERIMLNLLSNAIKFTPSGGHVKTTIWDENGRLFVSVEDTGVGIEEDQLGRIFDRFSQTEDIFTSSNEGSGIGLSLVKGFVKMHQGSIGVKSEIGKGSTFTFDIPIEVERDEEGNLLPVEAYDDLIYGTKIEVEFSDVKKRFYETF